MQLHKRDVIEAAAAILDQYGIADLTMRRLARELGITPGALYWHFPDKQRLLGAVADHILRPADVDAGLGADLDWRSRVRSVCSRMRDALLSHTDGAELVSASFAAGQSRGVGHLLTALAGAAAEAGLAPAQSELAARTILYYVLGATADEQSRMQWDAAGAVPETQSVIAPSANPSSGFDFGLRLLIDGIAGQPAAGRVSPDTVGANAPR
ncbi:TetR family transcriptional regulator [Mycobacterium kyorinense]|uniref:TetR family transcriptional regulator n=1 Tax=Mycobacterium kyorinense TaxID=487514 RepID=A0A1A2ZP07_9MYCO|nr:TetR family transcriptional regulator [Mycobacterium kyorinense]OBI52040.1 TetR family transcriptional regulator [Mycobacterium kyorinense]